jgi:predicted DNA repair protein MutK
VVALIVKLDDIGLHMAGRRSRSARAFGDTLVHVVPKLLTGLSAIGTAAMLWVGGGILLHGVEELRVAEPVTHAIHDVAHWAGTIGGRIVEWLVNALAGAATGLIVGGIIAAIVRQFAKHPEELIVD